MGVLSELKPEIVWNHFETLTKIPRTSKHEEKVVEFVKNFAGKFGLETKQDEVGNVLVRKPATSGHENVPGVVLQSHLDMVGVKAPDSDHDFMKDPIPLKIEGNYLRTKGTTLGADNGIGVAMMLAVMESKDLTHGPMEFLFTIDEEAGMTGAHGLKEDFLKGSRLINLDTEEWGAFYISCAGGGDSVIVLPAQKENVPADYVSFTVAVDGLKGGHSGADINLGRGSANKILARVMNSVLDAAEPVISEITGGEKRNSIAANSKCLFSVPADAQEKVRSAVQQRAGIIKNEFEKTDPKLNIKIDKSDKQASAFNKQKSADLIRMLVALPHGVQAMSPEVDGLVETSTNIGVIEMVDEGVKVVLLTRSAVNSAIDKLKEQIRTIAGFVGAKVEEPRGYPGWKPNMDSELLKVSKESYKKLYGEYPEVLAIHAGLECGIMSNTFPGIDMLSIGPEIHNAHSVDEEADIESVKKSWDLLVEILKDLA